MLGWIIAGLLLAGAITIVISGIITREKAQQKLEERGVKNAIVEKINECSNTLSIKDLDDDKTYELKGDDISDEFYEGMIVI